MSSFSGKTRLEFLLVVWLDSLSSLLSTERKDKTSSLLFIENSVEKEAPISIKAVTNELYEHSSQAYNPWVVKISKAIRLPLVLHNMPAKYLQTLPGFNGNNGITAEEPIAVFQNYTDN